MKKEAFAAAVLALLFGSALLLPGVCAAQTYSTSFTGVTPAITCTNTNITAGPGIDLNWNLPSGTQIVELQIAGGSTVFEQSFPLPAPAGSEPFEGVSATYAPIAFPYTFTISVTPKLQGATTSSISFLCASAAGTNFTINNGAPFNLASVIVPTLDRWTLLLLAILVAVSTFALFRIRSRDSRRSS
jgi:hypothetical protein